MKGNVHRRFVSRKHQNGEIEEEKGDFGPFPASDEKRRHLKKPS